MLVVPMATELRVPAVEVSLPRRFWLLWVFGKVDGDDFGVDFGEDSVRCFCLLCFGSGGWEAFAGGCVHRLGSLPVLRRRSDAGLPAWRYVYSRRRWRGGGGAALVECLSPALPPQRRLVLWGRRRGCEIRVQELGIWRSWRRSSSATATTDLPGRLPKCRGGC